MKIGIISDSHDHIENIKKGALVFSERKVDYVLHIGDMVSPGVLKYFKGLKLKGIFGNNDGDKFKLASAFTEIGGEMKGDFYEFKEGDLKFACYHGTELQMKDALIQCGKYDVVIYGHTHKCEYEKTGNTLALNPGTAHGFGNSATVMIFDTKIKEAEIVTL